MYLVPFPDFKTFLNGALKKVHIIRMAVNERIKIQESTPKKTVSLGYADSSGCLDVKNSSGMLICICVCMVFWPEGQCGRRFYESSTEKWRCDYG